MRANLIRVTYDMDYVETLRENGAYTKAMAFLLYLHNLEIGVHESTRYYADACGVSTGTAWAWLKEFNTVNN